MRSYDLNPLLRSSIGFDRMSRLLDSALEQDTSAHSYPPYNIEKLGDDDYRITMAVAGFSREELDVTQTGGSLVISGRKETKEGDKEFLHRGIAARSFDRRFQLADHIRIVNARLDNGLLHIDLHREVPEQMRPRTINIATDAEAGARSVEDQGERSAERPALSSESSQEHQAA
ncbi:Hsp20 family protein [Fodinicurvata sp. EGI_FJ10296]|uniref:Hsp20 family protein n=1 Tax=Fodinicurvata sp. EGI_FJ10296 TaxID=3231908 RepID=UPI0034563C60